MARYWADHAAELVAAEADRIKNLTADEIAEEYDERRVQRLLQNFAENPTAPVDLQLAMVDEPFEVRNQVSLAAAQADQGMPDDEGSLWSRGRSLLGRGFDAAYDGIKSQSRTVAPILEYQPQMLQAGFRTLVGAAEDPDELRGLALRSGLQVLGGGSPVPGASLADPNANLLKDLTIDRGALADRLESAQDYGEISSVDNLLAGSSFLQTDLGQITREFARTGSVDRSDWGEGFFISREAEISRLRDSEMFRAGGASATGGIVTAGSWTADQTGWDHEGTGYIALATAVDLGIEIAGGGAVDEMLDAGVRATGRGLINNPVLQGSTRADFLRGAGAHAGRYYQVDMPTAVNWVNGDTGTAVAEWLAKTDSVNDIFRRTRGQYKPEVLVRLADASDVDEVKSILLTAFADAGAAPTFRSLPGYRVRQHTSGWRLFGERPNGALDFSDHGQSLTTIDQMGQALGMPAEKRASWVERMARADDIGARYNAYADSVSEVEELLIARFDQGGYRVNPETARRLTSFNRAELDKARVAIDDMIAMPESSWNKMTIDGHEWEMPSAHLLADRAEVVALPNMRDLQRATGSQRLLFEAIEGGSDMNWATRNLVRFSNAVLPASGGGVKLPGGGRTPTVGNAIDWGLSALGVVQGAWKVSRLIRPAFPVRVVGIDEAARLDAAGHPSAWSHPISYFSDMFHSSSMTDLSGDLLEGTDEFIAARAGRSGRQPRVPVDRDVVTKNAQGSAEIWTPTDGYLNVTGRERFVHAWRMRLEKYANDRVVQQVVRANSASEAAVNLMSTPWGRGQIQELRNMHPGRITSDRELVAYLESVRRGAASLTGSNTQLMDYLKGSTARSRSGGWQGLDDIDLAPLADDFAPHALPIDVPLSRADRSRYDRAIDGVFEWLASRPTNRFSRSPVFRDAYRQALVELAPLTDDLDGLIRAAEGSGVFRGSHQDGLRVLKSTRTTPGSRMTPEMLDQFAKKKALEEVQGLLYDLTRSNQFFHTYQQVFPFGEAWKEGVQTWFRLISEHPFRIERRVQALGEAASDAGAFHENEYGQTVFTYPWSAQLMEKTTGVPFALEGGVRNLNLMGEGLPGLGFGAQLAAEQVIPEDPSWDWIRNLAMPYGDPESPRDAFSWVAPAFARRMFIGAFGTFTPDEERIFGSTRTQVERYMVSTGEYNIASVDDAIRLREESMVLTAKVYFVRGFVQAAAPASPLLRPQVIGPDGELAETQALLDRYFDLLEQDSNTALQRFMDEVGMNNMMLVGKNTQATVHGGIPMHGTGYDWVRENPEVVERHRQLFGFFAPQTPGGEFNNDAYSAALREGLIEPLTQREKHDLVNHKFASYIYRNARKKLYAQAQAAGRASLPEEHTEWLRDLKSQLADEWPGYATAHTISNLPSVLEVIDQGDIEAALEDELLAGTPAGQGLAEYWEQRQLLIGTADEAGILTDLNGQDAGWRTNPKMLAHRQWLIGIGDDIAASNSDFEVMWDMFLSRELRHDGTE